MSTQVDEFIQQHNGDMTAEQAAQLLELAEQGDTGALPSEPGSEPDATAAKPAEADATDGATNQEGQQQGQPEGEPDPANAVVLARDGVHTIPYDKLVEAREGEKAAKAELESVKAELTRLREEAQERADAGIAPTQADANLAFAEEAIANGVDPEIFGDFSEEALAKGVRTVAREEALAVVREEIAKELAPLKERQRLTAAQEAVQAHWDAMRAKHPDAESVFESKELADWIASQPSFIRRGYEAVMESGTATEGIELLDAFKGATGRTQQPAGDTAKAAAKAAIANAKTPIPNSLSDIPGGAQGPASRDEALLSMDAPAMAEAMENMTPAQIEAFLARTL